MPAEERQGPATGETENVLGMNVLDTTRGDSRCSPLDSEIAQLSRCPRLFYCRETCLALALPNLLSLAAGPPSTFHQILIVESAEMFRDFTSTLDAVTRHAGLPPHDFEYDSTYQHGTCEKKRPDLFATGRL